MRKITLLTAALTLLSWQTTQAQCITEIAPWTDDVEAHTPTTALDSSLCWGAVDFTNYDWNIDGAGSTPSSGTGPNSANGRQMIPECNAARPVGRVAENAMAR